MTRDPYQNGRRAGQAAVTAALNGDLDTATTMLQELIASHDLYAHGVAVGFFLRLLAEIATMLEAECGIDLGERLADLFLRLESE